MTSRAAASPAKMDTGERGTSPSPEKKYKQGEGEGEEQVAPPWTGGVDEMGARPPGKPPGSSGQPS
eukprot:9026367-Prorocentrum_lima.AAC.1